MTVCRSCNHTKCELLQSVRYHLGELCRECMQKFPETRYATLGLYIFVKLRSRQCGLWSKITDMQATVKIGATQETF